MNHLLTYIHGIILTDGRINISQIRRSTNENRNLSCITRFMNKSPWCPNRVTRRRPQFVMNHIQKFRSKAGDNHFSHSDGKTIWSHCIVTALVVSENNSFAWDFRSYFRESYCQIKGISFKNKNDLAIELINTYPVNDDEQVVDSWYTSKKLIETCSQKGVHLIGGLRMNRKIYLGGIDIKLSDFASDC